MPGSQIFSRRKVSKGQSYIDLLITIAVLSILGLTIFRISALSYELISYSRARITARHLAQEKLEIIRNLPYSQIGTIGGIPSGSLPQIENTQINGISFTSRTSIIYIDDPFDQVAPTDTNPADYKRVRVEVTWGGIATSSKNPITLTTDVSAGVVIEGEGGVLKVLVFDATGNPLPDATVRIISSGITPAVDTSPQTDPNGQVSLPGATECVACYRITVTKDGYSTERTYSINEIANPLKQDQGVFPDEVTQISFAIDRLSTINVSSLNPRESNYSAVGGITFRLKGTKIVGTDAYAQPVYKFDEPFTTDSGGNISILNLEWDVYQVYMEPTSSYDIGGTTPLLPLNILPLSTNTLTLVVYPESPHNLLTIAKNPSQSLVENTYIRIFDGQSFDQTKLTGATSSADFGQIFFPDLEEKTYQIEATASGFINYSGEVIVTGPTKEEIVLTPE